MGKASLAIECVGGNRPNRGEGWTRAKLVGDERDGALPVVAGETAMHGAPLPSGHPD
jgi:hypothetical protein